MLLLIICTSIYVKSGSILCHKGPRMWTCSGVWWKCPFPDDNCWWETSVCGVTLRSPAFCRVGQSFWLVLMANRQHGHRHNSLYNKYIGIDLFAQCFVTTRRSLIVHSGPLNLGTFFQLESVKPSRSAIWTRLDWKKRKYIIYLFNLTWTIPSLARIKLKLN